MKIIVGLGNSGAKYKNTRHNAGYRLIESLSSKNLKGFVLSTTASPSAENHMNNSGVVVKEILKKSSLSPDDLYIAHDDLDLRLGEFKIQNGRGPKVHNGVNSVEEELGTKDFWRIRIGIDNRNPDNRTPGEEYVLENFTIEEQKILDQVLEKILHFLKTNLQ